MKDSARYLKIVQWTDEDGCYVGRCPGLFYGGCHGHDAKAVFAELCEIVEETIELSDLAGKAHPAPMSGREVMNALQGID